MKKQVIFIHGGETFDSYEKYMTFLKERMVSDPQKELEKNKRRSRRLDKTRFTSYNSDSLRT